MAETKTKEKEEDKVVIDKNFKIKVREAVNKLFLIGWHDNHGSFQHEGQKWTVEIAGGCQAIVITRPDNRKFVVDVSEVVAVMLDDIKGVK